MLVWTSAAASDVGAKRRINEDALLARPDIGLWAVADGMGGHAAGDVASHAVVHALSHVQPETVFGAFVDQVEDVLMAVNQQLRDYSVEQLGGRTSGSTVVVLLLSAPAGVALWAGDSRLYRLRDGELVRLSRDHSAVQEMVEQGLISQADADVHPKSNVITRAIGGADSLFVDAAVFAPQHGDTFLLCSDGLYNEVSPAEIRRWLGESDPQRAVDGLLALSLERGARDNVSLIVVKLRES